MPFDKKSATRAAHIKHGRNLALKEGGDVGYRQRMKQGGEPHDDIKADRALVKKMVKKDALTGMKMGGVPRLRKNPTATDVITEDPVPLPFSKPPAPKMARAVPVFSKPKIK